MPHILRVYKGAIRRDGTVHWLPRIKFSTVVLTRYVSRPNDPLGRESDDSSLHFTRSLEPHQELQAFGMGSA